MLTRDFRKAMTPLGHCVTCANMSRSHHFGTPLEELRQPANLGCPSCDVIRRGIEGATGAELSELDPDSSFWIVMDPYGAYQFHIEVKLGPHTMDLELYTLESTHPPVSSSLRVWERKADTVSSFTCEMAGD